MKKLFSVLLALALGLATMATSFADYSVNPKLPNDPVTLTVFGPGVFSAVGEKDSMDLVTGVTKIGYHTVVERWNELYPNVTLDIQAQPWDNWQGAIQTACLSGDVDVILHGATITSLTEDLTSWMEASPEYASEINGTSSRRTKDNPGQWKVSGIPYTMSPCVVWLDTEIFKHYSVELPSADWTYADLEAIAAKLTGKDPVTGEETYGVQLLQMGGQNIAFNYYLIAETLDAEVFHYADTFADCSVNYLCDESVAAFETIARLAQYCSPEAREGLAVNEALNGTNNWAMLFLTGTAAYSQITANGMLGRYVPMNLPCVTVGANAGKPAPYLGDNNVAMYKDSDNKEWAWEFIKFLTTDPQMVNWLVGLNYLPNSKNAGEALYTIMEPKYADTFMYILNNNPQYSNLSTSAVYNNVFFGPVAANLVTAVSNVINGISSPKEAAQLMQNGIDEYVSGQK